MKGFPNDVLKAARTRHVSAEKNATIPKAPNSMKSYWCHRSCSTCESLHLSSLRQTGWYSLMLFTSAHEVLASGLLIELCLLLNHVKASSCRCAAPNDSCMSVHKQTAEKDAGRSPRR